MRQWLTDEVDGGNLLPPLILGALFYLAVWALPPLGAQAPPGDFPPNTLTLVVSLEGEERVSRSVIPFPSTGETNAQIYQRVIQRAHGYLLALVQEPPYDPDQARHQYDVTVWGDAPGVDQQLENVTPGLAAAILGTALEDYQVSRIEAERDDYDPDLFGLGDVDPGLLGQVALAPGIPCRMVAELSALR